MSSEQFETLNESNDWLSLKVQYVGWGTARFTNLAGRVEGKTSAVYNDDGTYTIEMKIDRTFVGEEDVSVIPYGNNRFFAGQDPSQIYTNPLYVPHVIRNPCASLIITTDEGNFTANNVNLNYEYDNDNVISFKPKTACFEGIKPDTDRYMVIPLMNFVGYFGQREIHPEVATHPLRIHKIPTYVEGCFESKEAWALQHMIGRVICFDFNQDSAFIERLPDYDTRIKQLQTCQAKHLICPPKNSTKTSVRKASRILNGGTA